MADASGVIYGTRPRVWQTVRTFFVVTYPAAVWDSRRFVMLGVAITFVPAIVFGAWLVGDARALDATGTARQRHQYVHDEFEQYYSDQPHVQFFTEVTTNNILVSFEAFAGGAALGLFGILAMVANGLNLGQAAAWMITDGSGWRFLGLILPHGLLELSAICIAGGTGLRLGWTIVAPGDRSRSAALAEQGRRSIVIVIGLATMFICAGTIEGFVTGSNLPAGVKVGDRRHRLAGVCDLPGGVRPAGRGPGLHRRSGRGAARRRRPRRRPDPRLQPPGGLDPQIGIGQLRGELAGGGIDHGGAQAAEPGSGATAFVQRGHRRRLAVGTDPVARRWPGPIGPPGDPAPRPPPPGGCG